MIVLIFEVIVQNEEEAIRAEQFGADRLELITGGEEHGLTPSYGTIKQVLNAVSIPVHVMIRPNNYYYNYTEKDMKVIKEDILKVLELGGKRIVFGALTENKTINEKVLAEVIQISSELNITFHKAFDEVPSLIDAYQTLSKYKRNVKRILTSGGEISCLDGQSNLKKLVQLSIKENGPRIMPGADLDEKNISEIHASVDAEQYHFGPTIRVNRSYNSALDCNKMSKIVDVLRR